MGRKVALAFAEMKYNFSARVRLPARLYYDGKPLAEVTG
jgi:hypothetical protein